MTIVPAQQPPAASSLTATDAVAPEARRASATPAAYAARAASAAVPAADLLHHPDPVVVADAAATENLLRCWVRETGTEVPSAGESLEVPLGDGLLLRAVVRYRSAAG